MEKLALKIQNMHCEGCVGRVRRLLEQIPGVAVKSVAIGSADVQHDPGKASSQHITSALAEAGHPAEPAESGTGDDLAG